MSSYIVISLIFSQMQDLDIIRLFTSKKGGVSRQISHLEDFLSGMFVADLPQNAEILKNSIFPSVDHIFT